MTESARCVVRRDEELLVEEVFDGERGERAFRPLGRRVGDDETPEEAVEGEFSDVLGVGLDDLSAFGAYDDVRVFEADADESWLYAEEGFTVYDPEDGETTRVCWLHVDDFRKYGEKLRPEGLLADL